MSHKERTKFLSSGRPLRPFTTRSTPLPVMCGPTGVCSTRYGVLDTNHLRLTKIMRCNKLFDDVFTTVHAATQIMHDL